MSRSSKLFQQVNKSDFYFDDEIYLDIFNFEAQYNLWHFKTNPSSAK